jgi:two-component system chemotaxis sensor kinase CheA
MRLVLDNVDQGFITIDREGIMADEHSAVIERWFDRSAPGGGLADYLAPFDPSFAERFALGWLQVKDGVLPLEVAIVQLPARLTVDQRTFAVAFRPIAGQVEGPSETFVRMLVVITDITAQLAQEESEGEQREVLVLVQHIVADRAGVEQFREEGGSLVERICAVPPPATVELKRLVHTLKGNAGIFGLARLADRCQLVETHLDLEDRATPEGLEDLRTRWREVDRMLAAFLGAAPRDAIELRQDDIQELLAAIARGAGAAELRGIIARWALEPMARRLRRIGEQVQRLGRSLGKGEIRVIEEPNGVRLSEERWSPFWTSLIHIVRNAVDHGVESREERLAAGKPPLPTVTLRTFFDGAEVVIEVQDDGRGVAWEALAARASLLGLPTRTRADLVAALFSDGVSTRDQVTQISGRGTGAGAALAVCQALGGGAEVRSEPGRGTTFSFRFPAAGDAPSAGPRLPVRPAAGPEA